MFRRSGLGHMLLHTATPLHWKIEKACLSQEDDKKQDQVHLARRTHFVDLVIHDICSQKIIPYIADLVIHNICSQQIMPYFFDKL